MNNVTNNNESITNYGYAYMAAGTLALATTIFCACRCLSHAKGQKRVPDTASANQNSLQGRQIKQEPNLYDLINQISINPINENKAEKIKDYINNNIIGWRLNTQPSNKENLYKEVFGSSPIIILNDLELLVNLADKLLERLMSDDSDDDDQNLLNKKLKALLSMMDFITAICDVVSLRSDQKEQLIKRMESCQAKYGNEIPKAEQYRYNNAMDSLKSFD